MNNQLIALCMQTNKTPYWEESYSDGYSICWFQLLTLFLTISGTNLTLFSKFFSSFLHSTCSLSVFLQYLALDEIYHLFWAVLSNNSTLWVWKLMTVSPQPPCCLYTKHLITQPHAIAKGYHLLWRCFPTRLSASRCHSVQSMQHSQNYNSDGLRVVAAPISSLSWSRFNRLYWGNHCCFLFLRLMICLNSARSFI